MYVWESMLGLIEFTSSLQKKQISHRSEQSKKNLTRVKPLYPPSSMHFRIFLFQNVALDTSISCKKVGNEKKI